MSKRNEPLPVGTTLSIGGMHLVVTGTEAVEYLVLARPGNENGDKYLLTPACIHKEAKRIKAPKI